MLGLDSGTSCDQLTTDVNVIDSEYTEASLAWLGGYVYTCMAYRGVARISLTDGSVDIAPINCSAVTSHEGGLLALVSFESKDLVWQSSYLARFASFADMVERNAEWTYQMSPWGTRMTTHGEKVLFAWHAADQLDAAPITDGGEFSSTPLEGFHDWISGMDVTADGKLVITGWEGAGVRLFEVETGAALGQLPTSDALRTLGGIECLSGGAAE